MSTDRRLTAGHARWYQVYLDALMPTSRKYNLTYGSHSLPPLGSALVKMLHLVFNTAVSLTLKVDGVSMEVDPALFSSQSPFWEKWLADNAMGKDLTAIIDGLDVSEMQTLLDVISRDTE
ncbi:hypothetical protein H0H93_009895 [Arthromyces matolae]|nr:hypothetical protein H0H93_009895 [Arthromyces matolae]